MRMLYSYRKENEGKSLRLLIPRIKQDCDVMKNSKNHYDEAELQINWISDFQTLCKQTN
jgi:hypothetical protein